MYFPFNTGNLPRTPVRSIGQLAVTPGAASGEARAAAPVPHAVAGRSLSRLPTPLHPRRDRRRRRGHRPPHARPLPPPASPSRRRVSGGAKPMSLNCAVRNAQPPAFISGSDRGTATWYTPGKTLSTSSQTNTCRSSSPASPAEASLDATIEPQRAQRVDRFSVSSPSPVCSVARFSMARSAMLRSAVAWANPAA